MRYIDLGPGGAKGIGPWQRVLALMAFPDDEKARLGHLAAMHARELGEVRSLLRRARAPTIPFLEWVEHIAESSFEHDGGFVAVSEGIPGVEETRKAWTQRSLQGQLSAELLRLLLAPPEPPRGRRERIGLRQAVHIVRGHLSTVNAPEIAKSRASIMRAWKDFKSVSHLWLALRLAPEPTLGAFLARSEGLRLRALKDSSLREVATWAVPKDVLSKLPAINPLPPPFSAKGAAAIRGHWKSYRHTPCRRPQNNGSQPS